MPAARLAVDLSSETLRVVEGLPGSPLRCGEAGVPANSVVGGRVVDQAAVGQALRQLVARSEITASRAMVAASDRVASFRVLTFPQDTSDADIDSVVRSQVDLGADRMAYSRVDVPSGGGRERVIFAAVWDRRHVEAIAGAVRHAGLEPVVVDLKSLCLARALTVDSCVLVDLTGDQGEIVLIDQRVPRLWHAINVDPERDVALAVADGLRPMLGFDQRYGAVGLGRDSPIVVRADPALGTNTVTRLEELSGRTVTPVAIPPRIGEEVRYVPYLTCLGLIMRRSY